MTVRELIVKFGFQVDRQSQRNVENSVNGIRNLMQQLLQGIQVVFSSSGVQDVIQETRQLVNAAQDIGDSFEESFRIAEDAAQETQEAMEQVSQSTTALQKMSTAGEKLKTAGESITKVGKTVSVASAAVTGLGTAAVATAASFESSMSQVQATMGISKDAVSEVNGESVNTMDTLSNLAKKMGSETAFSASECSEALNYLALAGYDTQEMYDTLPTVLNLAAAGSIDLASASDMVTDAMSALGMGTNEAESMVDQMAKTASSTNTSVSQLGEGILTIGATAKSVKGGTAELNTALGILANNGVKGAEGGTHLRNIILSLQNPTDKAAACMKELGVKVYDSKGNMRSMNTILNDLNSSMEGMTDAKKSNIVNKIFNKTDLSSVNALLANTGDTWKELQHSIADSSGAAKDMADTQLDNMQGQLTILKSALEGLSITIGEVLLPTVKLIVSRIQWFVDKLNGMSEGAKRATVVIGLIIAAIGPALIIFGKLISTIGMVTTTIPKLVKAFQAFQKILSVSGLKIMAIVAAIVILLLIIEDFIHFLKGDNSLIGEMFDKAGIGADNAREAILNAWDFIKTAAGQVKDKLLEVWESISTAFLTIANVLYSVGSAIFQALAAVIEAVFQAVKAFWDTWGSEVLAWFQVLWSSLAGTLSGFLDVIKGIADLITAIFTGDWQAAWEAVKDIFLGIWKIIVSYFTAVLETIKLVLTIALSTISSVWKAVWEAIKKFFLNIWNKIVSFLSNVLTKIKTYFTNTFDNIRSSIAEKVTGIKDAIVNGITEAVTWIKNLPQEAIQWGADMIDGMVDGIKGAIGKVKDAVSGVAENIKSFLHFSVPDEGPLTDYESWMPDFMSGLAKGIAENKDVVLEKVRSLAGDMSILMQAATAQSATVAAGMGSYNKQNSIMQTNNFNSTYIGNDREVAKHISKGMKKSASDATTELARAMAFSRG